jgi:hypothetical protein
MTNTDVLSPPAPARPAPAAHEPLLPPPRSSWTAARIVAVVLGSILGVAGLGLVTAGGTVGWAAATQRDSSGYFHTDTQRLTTDGFALTSDVIELGDEARSDVIVEDLVDVRLRATSSDPATPVFVGIARTSDVDAYLRNVAHDVVTDLDGDRAEVDHRTVDGDATPADPRAQAF